MDKIRAFIAIPLPESLIERLGRLQRGLEHKVPGCVRWVRPQGIHLTLKFLGDTATEKLADIESALSVVARNAATCTLTVGGMGCFPNPRRPRVIWVGVEEPTGRLALLQSAIEEVSTSLGFPPERRDFHPHLTLGRVHRRASRQDVARLGEVISTAEMGTLCQISAARLDLIRSVLKPSGAEYTTLAEFHLERGAANSA